jgi:hypothetical protein
MKNQLEQTPNSICNISVTNAKRLMDLIGKFAPLVACTSLFYGTISLSIAGSAQASPVRLIIGEKMCTAETIIRRNGVKGLLFTQHCLPLDVQKRLIELGILETVAEYVDPNRKIHDDIVLLKTGKLLTDGNEDTYSIEVKSTGQIIPLPEYLERNLDITFTFPTGMNIPVNISRVATMQSVHNAIKKVENVTFIFFDIHDGIYKSLKEAQPGNSGSLIYVIHNGVKYPVGVCRAGFVNINRIYFTGLADGKNHIIHYKPDGTTAVISEINE